MHLDLRTLSDIAGRPVAVEAAIERLRQLSQQVFSETLAALDIDTLRNDPARFHAAARAVEAALEALGHLEASDCGQRQGSP
jgi:hypothetical protein